MVDGEQAFCDSGKKVSWCLPKDCEDLPLPDGGSETTCTEMLSNDPDMCMKQDMLEVVSFLCRKSCLLCSAPSPAKKGSEERLKEDGTKSDEKDEKSDEKDEKKSEEKEEGEISGESKEESK